MTKKRKHDPTDFKEAKRPRVEVVTIDTDSDDHVQSKHKNCKHEDVDKKGHNKLIQESHSDPSKFSHEKKKRPSCMKHKKQDRPKPHPETETESDKSADKSKSKKFQSESTKTSRPTQKKSLKLKDNDVSCNWKQLQKIIAPKKKNKSKQKETTRPQPKTTKNEKPNSSKVQAPPEIWFDDVDEILIQSSRNKSGMEQVKTADWDSSSNPLVKENAFSGLTKTIAMDCEMVGIGMDGEDSALARVSIVNQYGRCIYDAMVLVKDEITDYRTQFSGIRPGDLDKGTEFSTVQKYVSDVITDRILVGHAIHNDLKVLYLSHPRKAIRDTSKFRAFRKLSQGKTPSLKKLSQEILGVKVQDGEHNSIQDAQAAMRLYTMHRQVWEKEIKLKSSVRKHKLGKDQRRKSNSRNESDSDA